MGKTSNNLQQYRSIDYDNEILITTEINYDVLIRNKKKKV